MHLSVIARTFIQLPGIAGWKGDHRMRRTGDFLTKIQDLSEACMQGRQEHGVLYGSISSRAFSASLQLHVATFRPDIEVALLVHYIIYILLHFRF